MPETCLICGCELHREKDTYACPNKEGRSHATKHHYVAERFFGRTKNRRGERRESILNEGEWPVGETGVFCYECHEELLHNPILLPPEIKLFAELVRDKGLDEKEKTENREKLAGRIKLLNEVIKSGLVILSQENNR